MEILLGAIQMSRNTFWPILDPLPQVTFGDAVLTSLPLSVPYFLNGPLCK